MAVLIVAGCVGWFRQVWPHAQHIAVPVKVQKFKYTTVRTKVAHIEIDESHRARLPVHTPSVMAGVKGGIAGGAAMIVPATLYGLIRYHSIWYAVNLLGGAGVAGWSNPTLAEITHFRLSALITATIIHAVGLTADRSAVWGHVSHDAEAARSSGWNHRPGFVDGMLHSALPLINPFLADRIDWWWFLVSQVTFGLVAGWVVWKASPHPHRTISSFRRSYGIGNPGDDGRAP